MNTEILIAILNKHKGKEVFIQAGFNRFAIESVNISDDGNLILITELDATNPPVAVDFDDEPPLGYA